MLSFLSNMFWHKFSCDIILINKDNNVTNFDEKKAEIGPVFVFAYLEWNEEKRKIIKYDKWILLLL